MIITRVWILATMLYTTKVIKSSGLDIICWALWETDWRPRVRQRLVLPQRASSGLDLRFWALGLV